MAHLNLRNCRHGALVFVLALASGTSILCAEVGGKAAFERLKDLEGDWQGWAGDENTPAQVSFRVTSGGSAVFETQFPGSAHEMINAYHLDGDQLVVTHYCSLGNQPRMVLNSENSNEGDLVFDFNGGSNIDPAVDMHVHSGRIHLKEGGKLTSEWAVYHGGKESQKNVLNLQRK